ncbi:MAG: hypothetical protein ACK2TU_04155 [Anaerolineales bacterium]|jgi:hypothetical protein
MKVKTNLKVGSKLQDSLEQVKEILKIAGETISRPRVVANEFVNAQN